MSKKKSTGWKIVWEIYPFCNLCKGCIKPIILTALTLIPLLFSKKTPFEHIEIVSTLITSAFPSIIGFVLTGYALIIGFSSSEIISYLAKDRNEKKIFTISNCKFNICYSNGCYYLHFFIWDFLSIHSKGTSTIPI